MNNRYDFMMIFDVTNGNPNGDPDLDNAPRTDPDTHHGLVTDVCLKRKIRNYVALTQQGQQGRDIYVAERSVLTTRRMALAAAVGVEVSTETDADEEDQPETTKGKKPKGRAKKMAPETQQQLETALAAAFWDVRTFGCVTGKTAGIHAMRGPVQITFARSVDPITTQQHCISRVAVETEQESVAHGGLNQTLGRKWTVPYGLYVAYGFVSPALARRSGFSETDLSLLCQAIREMFEHDRSASRGMMVMRELVVFKHDSALGNARAHTLFDLVKIARKDPSSPLPPRSYSDYEVTIGQPPTGVQVLRNVA